MPHCALAAISRYLLELALSHESSSQCDNVLLVRRVVSETRSVRMQSEHALRFGRRKSNRRTLSVPSRVF
jgi:hypothetical protein